jgi:hypothetical protein
VSMSEKAFEYDMMVEEALKGVVIKALKQVATTGFPNEHHFYITFKTKGKGVDIPSFLITRYPEEMTIVLQHQYWDLQIREYEFEVALSFYEKKERLLIPFNCISAFSDPSVKFGLQFQVIEEAEEEEVPENLLKNEATPDDKKISETVSGEVVSLDTFRKNTTKKPN